MSTTLPHIKSSLSDNLFPYQVEISFIKENFLLGFKIGETIFLTEKKTVNTTATTDNISFNLQPSGSLDYGKYIVKVKAYDKAGNPSSEQEFLIHLLTNEKLQALLFLKNRDKDKKITDKEKEQDTISFPYLEKQAKIRKAKEAEQLNEFIAEIKKLFTSVRFLSFGFEIVKGGLLGVSLPQVVNYKHATLSLAKLLKEEGMIEDRLARGIPAIDKIMKDVSYTLATVLPTNLQILKVISENKQFKIVVNAIKTFDKQLEETTLTSIRQTEIIFGQIDQSIKIANKNVEMIIGSFKPTKINLFAIKTITFFTYVFGSSSTTISDIAIDKIGRDYAIVSWKTNHYTINNKVNYGKTVSYGEEAWDANYTKEHKVKITGLQSNTHYVFEVMSQGKNYVYDAYYGVTTKK